jgi:hypothetical protein
VFGKRLAKLKFEREFQNRYNTFFSLGLTDAEKADSVELPQIFAALGMNAK